MEGAASLPIPAHGTTKRRGIARQKMVDWHSLAMRPVMPVGRTQQEVE
jgi:hypothetical protein